MVRTGAHTPCRKVPRRRLLVRDMHTHIHTQNIDPKIPPACPYWLLMEVNCQRKLPAGLEWGYNVIACYWSGQASWQPWLTEHRKQRETDRQNRQRCRTNVGNPPCIQNSTFELFLPPVFSPTLSHTSTFAYAHTPPSHGKTALACLHQKHTLFITNTV